MFKYSVHPNDRFTDAGEVDHYIQIDEGPFDGSCFNISRIEFMGEDGEGNGRITFDYALFHLTEGLILDEVKIDLEKAVGEILNDVIVNTLQNTPDDENRNLDIEQLTA